MPFGGEDAESYFDEGLTAAMKGELAQAAALLAKATQLDPNLHAAYYQLGRCHYRMGNAEQAVGALGRAVERMPNMASARVDLGYALLQLNQVAGARKCFSELADKSPGDTRALLGLGACAYAAGEWDTALKFAESVILQEGGDRFEALFLAGRAAFMLKMRDVMLDRLYTADALLDKFIENSPAQPEGYYLRGQIYYLTGEHAKSLAAFQAAEAAAQPDRHYTAYHEHFGLVDIIAGEGWCHKRLDNPEAARSAGRRILELKPESKRGRRLAGEAGE